MREPRPRPRRPAALALTALALLAGAAGALVVRHDRPDTRYRALGAAHPAVAFVGTDGEGTLITPCWVLTAGHVAADLAPRTRRVRLAGRDLPVRRVVFHPGWAPGKDDLALLELARPAAGIAPVPLNERRDEVGREVVFVGRGDTGTGRTGAVRADRRLRGATNRVEEADPDELFFTFSAPGEPGATDLEGVSGPGDSGGPALAVVAGRTVLLGVSIWGRPQPGRPAGSYGAREGYARISSYLGWIRKVTAGPCPGA